MKKKITDEVLKEANQIAEQLGLDMNIPRIVGRQQHRSSHPATNSTKFWRRSLIIPYLDSINSSLELRFSTENTPAYALTYLHPLHILLITIDELKEKTASFYSFYHLEGIEKELELWYKIWKDKKLSSEELKDIVVCQVIKETEPFFPSTKRALMILLAQPCTTSTVELSLGTLRRIKTWLLSTCLLYTSDAADERSSVDL